MALPHLFGADKPQRRCVAVCLDTLGDLVLREPLFRALTSVGVELTVVVRTVHEALLRRFESGVASLTTDLHPYLFGADQWREVAELALRVRETAPDFLLFPTYSRTALEGVLRALLPEFPAISYAVREASFDDARRLAMESGVAIGDPIWDESRLRGYNAGIRLKAKSGWKLSGNGTDEFGFSALPGGERLTSFNNSKGSCGFWWTCTEFEQSSAWYRCIIYSLSEMSRGPHPKRMGFSVRCLKDK